jgi:hypothetical protein
VAKFLFAYRGGDGMAAAEADQAAEMEKWGAWLGQLGAAVVDGGNPFAQSTAVSSTGTGNAASGLGGYSLVNATSLDEASNLTKGCPVLDNGGTVDVYECIEM